MRFIQLYHRGWDHHAALTEKLPVLARDVDQPSTGLILDLKQRGMLKVRYLAARKLGLDRVPVHVAEGLTPAQVRAYRLMDNRSHQETDWDLELLTVEVVELRALDFDLNFTGFEPRETDALLVGAEQASSPLPAVLPSPRARTPFLPDGEPPLAHDHASGCIDTHQVKQCLA